MANLYTNKTFQKVLSFATSPGTQRLDTVRLIPFGGLFRRDSWSAIAKSGPESAAGMGYFMPVFAYMASKERPGERLAAFAPEVAGIGIGFVATPVVTAALSVIPGFSMLPGGVRSMVSVLATQALINEPVTRKLGAYIRQANRYVQQKRSLDMGGGFRDSYGAAASRAAALQEMSSALGASRRYLGQEALLLHG